jgi:peptidoglycan biosynthesis protein MviN/MurJ (putative lipid II flippase)
MVAIVSIPGYWFFSKYFGAPGIACAASLAMLIQFFLLYRIWSGRFNNMHNFKKVLITIAKIIGISIIGGAITFGIKKIVMHFGITDTKFIHNIIICVVAGIPSLIVMFTILERMRISNSRAILTRIFKR